MHRQHSNSVRPAALVTGGAIRLGKAIAVALAKAGYDIALHYHSSAPAAEQTQREIEALGVRCERFAADLTAADDYSGFMARVHSALPGLCVLINSASGYIQAAIHDSNPAQFDHLFAVNLRAPFFLSRAFAEKVSGGHIINIIDNKTGFNQFQYAVYLLTKKALAEFTRMAALEFAPHIRVNGVSPGVILPMNSRSEAYMAWRVQAIPVQRKGDTRHITGTVLYLLSNDFVNGQIITVDGGENILHVGRNAGEYEPDGI